MRSICNGWGISRSCGSAPTIATVRMAEISIWSVIGQHLSARVREKPIGVLRHPFRGEGRPVRHRNRTGANVRSMQDCTTPADRRGGRLVDRVAVVVGAGQTPGETIGNGRAIAVTFAREGADVLCVDR